MAEKRARRKQEPHKRGEAQVKEPGGRWPDPQAREEISRAEAERDAGKHAKNPDWKKRW